MGGEFPSLIRPKLCLGSFEHVFFIKHQPRTACTVPLTRLHNSDWKSLDRSLLVHAKNQRDALLRDLSPDYPENMTLDTLGENRMFW